MQGLDARVLADTNWYDRWNDRVCVLTLTHQQGVSFHAYCC